MCNYASTYEPSVIALTETWLRKDIPSGFLNLRQYVHYRKDRNFSRGGGSLLLVRDDIPSRPVLLSNQDLKIDAVACQISLIDKSTLGCLCVYRPPNSDKDDDCKMLSVITDFLNLEFDYNLILGDFNFPDINWSLSSSCCQQSENFLRFAMENFLIQHVATPTRKSSQSLIDLVLTTHGTVVSDLCVSEELDNSDHYSITLSLKIRPDKIVRKLMRRDICKANWSRFRQLLSSSDWQPF
ncbi:MAG: endonuclease/exonuclease/phosphatase family protein, partial [Pseudomonadota bacterium]